MDYFLFNFSGVQFHYTMSQTLEAQKAEAISENDLGKAALLDRKPFRHIEQNHWRKMQKIFEEPTAIDHSKPIPIQLNN